MEALFKDGCAKGGSVSLEEDVSFGQTNSGPRHEGWRSRHGRWTPSVSYMNRHGFNSKSPKDTPAHFGAQGNGGA